MRFWLALRKTPAGFLRRGLNSSRLRCYFLQHPVLQHSLPLQHDCFDVVAAVAVPTKARTLRINKKYFINSSIEFRMEFGHAMFSRAEPLRLRECAARRRNGRTLNAFTDLIVVQRNCAAQLRLCGKRVCIAEIKE